MEYSKMMYIISKNDYDQLKEKAGNKAFSEDMEMVKRNEAMIENKILQQQQSDKSWEKYGNKLSQVIKKGVEDSNLGTLPAPALNTTLSSPTSQSFSQSETSFIRMNAPAKWVNKMTRFFYLLKEIPGILVDEQSIYVNGQFIGPSLEVIKNLTTTNKTLKYPVAPLLFKLTSYPNAVALILNKQAQAFFEGGLEPPTVSSTPRKGVEKSLGEEAFLSADEGDLDPTVIERGAEGGDPRRGVLQETEDFQEPRRGTGFNKKRKKKIKWKSIF